MNLLLKSVVVALTLSNMALASTYNSRCSKISNDMENFADKDLAFRLSLCENQDHLDCIKFAETETYHVPKEQKAFDANLYFKFTDDEVEKILKSKKWDREKARIQYGTVIGGKYKSSGTSLWLIFKDHAFRSSPFDSSTRYDVKTGVIDTQSCEVIHVVD